LALLLSLELESAVFFWKIYFRTGIQNRYIKNPSLIKECYSCDCDE